MARGDGGVGVGHMTQLDGLRAISVALVIVQHNTESSRLLGLDVGAGGVWLFFVLSGFLITGILIRARDRAATAGVGRGGVWAAFWMRRALRIFPLYFAAIAAAAAIGIPAARRSWPWLATFTANFRGAPDAGFGAPLTHFWSLTVEEQFYWAWPAACLYLPRRHLGRLAVAGVVAAPLIRVAALKAGAAVAGAVLMPGCLDGLGLGAVLALAGRGPRAGVAAVGLALAGAAAAAKHADTAWSVRSSAECLGYALFSWWLVGRAAPGFRGVTGRLLTPAPLAYLGRISYGIYVIHGLVPAAIKAATRSTGVSFGLPGPGPVRAAYVAAVSVALASLSWSLLERPANDLKRFFPYVPRRHAPRGAGPLR